MGSAWRLTTAVQDEQNAMSMNFTPPSRPQQLPLIKLLISKRFETLA